MTNTPATRTPNRYEKAMLWGGGVLLIVGALLALLMKRSLDSAQFIAELTGSDSGVGGPTAGLWFGIALAAIGVVLLIVVLAIRASRGR